MAEPVTLRYGNQARQVVQIFSPLAKSHETAQSPLLIFIHGGAWRSESIDEHTSMAKKIAQRGIAVALVEYRLSLRDEQTGIIANQHPAHLHDVFAALRYLLLNQDSSSAPYSIDHVCLAGHSVGAWMISAALLDCDQAIPSGLPPCPSLGTSIERATIRSKIKAWIGLDGIYDVQSLLQEYPDYAGFVSQAFIDPKSEPLPSDNPASDERLKSVSLPAWPYNAAGDGEEGLPHVYIAHSKDDELLSFRQSIEAAQHFIEKLRVDRKTTQTTESHGSSSTKTVSHAPPFVNVDLTSLTGKHRPMLETGDFAKWIADIVERETKR